jgi:hypothetical protein
MRYRNRKVNGSVRGLALPLMAAVALAGCDNILDVRVPGQVTEGEAFRPTQATLLVNSAIADLECSLGDFVSFTAAGYEDVAQKTVGWWGAAFQYPNTPPGGCSTSATGLGWWNQLQSGRWFAEQTYERLANEWTPDQVENREALLGTSAIYAGLAYTHLGEYFCEVTVDMGPLLSWKDALQVGEDYLTRAVGHINTSGDYAIATGVTQSALQMAYLLRARNRLAQAAGAGSNAPRDAALMDLARQDAERVSQGFTSYITRESGGNRSRWNRYGEVHVGLGWVSILGPITWWNGPSRAPNPATGETWPAVIPFTGYWALAIAADGRAVTDEGHPITLESAGAVADGRVPVTNLNSLGGPNQYPMWQQAKFLSSGDDIPLAKWEEAWLIRAEVAGGQQAIDLVNQIRAAHQLPLVTYLSPTDQAGIRRMVIEEWRRTHFLEGRYWSTKLRHDDLLWFPRNQGATRWNLNFGSGVRLVMAGGEYTQNPNLEGLERGDLCPTTHNPL